MASRQFMEEMLTGVFVRGQQRQPLVIAPTDRPRLEGTDIQIDANGVITDVALAFLRAALHAANTDSGVALRVLLRAERTARLEVADAQLANLPARKADLESHAATIRNQRISEPRGRSG